MAPRGSRQSSQRHVGPRTHTARNRVDPTPEAANNDPLALADDREVTGSVISIVTAFATPSVIVLTIGYLFARSYTTSYFAYFGIDVDIIGFSNQAVALRSTQVLWSILIAVFAAVLFIGVIQVAGHILEHSTKSYWRWIPIGGVTVGVLIAILGLVAYLRDQSLGVVALVCVAIGFFALWYARFLWSKLSARTRTHMPYVARLTVTIGVIGVLGLLLFAITTRIASSYGLADAEDLAAKLQSRLRAPLPEVILDTKEPLFLTGKPSGVSETALPESYENQVFRFRYRGLALLAADGGKLIVIPRYWAEGGGFAVVVRDDDQIRVQYLARGF